MQTELEMSFKLRKETRPDTDVTIPEPEVAEQEPQVAVSGVSTSLDQLLRLVQRLQEEKAAY